MASSSGDPTKAVGGEDTRATWATTASATLASGAIAIPMHMDAQQDLPAAFSCLELLSGVPSQCADAFAFPWWDAAAVDGASIALAITGATSTANVKSACRSLRRLRMWRFRCIVPV